MNVFLILTRCNLDDHFIGIAVEPGSLHKFRDALNSIVEGTFRPIENFLRIVNSSGGVFSPDGRWFAYASTEVGGRFEVYVQPFPPTGAKYQVSSEGGRDPLWSPDGKQLFYNTVTSVTPGKLVAVDVQTQPAFNFGKPAPIPITGVVFGGPGTNYDITPDGKHFLVTVSPSSPTERLRGPGLQINVVLNWIEGLKARLPKQ